MSIVSLIRCLELSWSRATETRQQDCDQAPSTVQRQSPSWVIVTERDEATLKLTIHRVLGGPIQGQNLPPFSTLQTDLYA